MGFAERKFMDYLREHLLDLDIIVINEMLTHLTGCFTKATVERLRRNVINEGNTNTLWDFFNDLSKRDDWVNHLISALRSCKLHNLANDFQAIYNSYQLPTSHGTHSSPQSLPPSATRSIQSPPPPYQPDDEQRNLSLPAQLYPKPPNPQPGTSPRISQSQSEPETAQSHPSPNKEESPAAPQLYFPPSPGRVPLSDSPAAPLNWKTSEGKASRIPIPETSPDQAAPLEDGDKPVNEASKPPEPRPPAAYSHSVRKDVAESEQRRDQSVYGEVDDSRVYSLPSPHADHRLGVSEPITSPQRREQSVHQQVSESCGLASPPADHRVQAYEAGPSSQHRERSLHQRETASNVVPFSPGRREDNDEGADEISFSKPEVLQSTLGFGDVTVTDGQMSEWSQSPDFQISDSEEESASRGVSDRAGSSPTSPPSNTRMSTPVIRQPETPATSTPNHRSTWSNSRKSPEENDFTYAKAVEPGAVSPGYNAPPDDHRSQQPEENSFELSREYSDHRLQFSEEPSAELMEGNHSTPRHRQPNTSDNHEPNDRIKYRNNSKSKEETKLEKPVIMTLAVAVVGLSLFLLWKKQRT